MSLTWKRFVLCLIVVGLIVTPSTQSNQVSTEDGDAYSLEVTTPAFESTTSENKITIFPSTTPLRSNRGQPVKPLKPFTKISSKRMDHLSRDLDNSSELGKRKNFRLMNFLRHFHLDFSKFDSTCIKRGGRGVLGAPIVNHSQILKYTRRRNRNHPRNRYAMTLYECLPGYEFPPGSADRMFCSKNKWVGPRPVCLTKGSLEDSESECSKCQQICNRDAGSGVSALCSCYAGYEMVNGTCLDVDECLTNNGGCSGICFNKLGSFQCYCPQGFQVAPDGKKCIDKNECLLRNGHGPCQDRCNNTVGSYTCTCERIPGTKLATDKHSCEDINECLDENNFGCSHTCLNTFGNAFCSCPNGLILSTTDYKTCLTHMDVQDQGENVFGPENLVEPSEETVTAPPSSNELILPEIQSSRFECPPGSEHDSENPQICVEHEDCSSGNGGCDHTCVPSGSFRFCSCRIGYELLNETTCMEVNECEQENGGCDHTCVNTEGSFHCDCKAGYHLLEDKRTCKVEYCEQPPKLSSLSEWKCQFPENEPVTNDLRPVGTTCKLQCQVGLILQTSPPPPGHSNVYHHFHYEIVNDEPEIVQKENQVIIKCLESGSWSREAHDLRSVTCVPTNCPRLLEPENGSLFPEGCADEQGVPQDSQCFVLCSPGFYPKNGRIRTCSKILKWFPEENPVCLRLPPTPRPHIHCPSDLIIDLKASQSSAHVTIPRPQANMDWYRYVEADPPWAKSLEWDVPAGVTQVMFTARSPVSNDSATCHFKIHIVDREAPRVQGCPTSFEIRLEPGETSKEVWWSNPKFTDNVKLHYVQQSHTPGHLLTRGSHHITYVAGDAEANKARCAFTITVHGPENYEMADHSFYSNNIMNGRHMIICPNLKTGRWNLHFAYYLPPGCRYHSPPQYGLISKIFKQNGTPKDEEFGVKLLSRRATARNRRRPYGTRARM